MAHVIWDQRGNPPPKYVSDRLGMQRWQLRAAIDAIKTADCVIIYDDGTVTDEHGDTLGNIYDEL